jgi:putative colanic acid biosynthesis UDP-glucose lipid carrier transferase
LFSGAIVGAQAKRPAVQRYGGLLVRLLHLAEAGVVVLALAYVTGPDQRLAGVPTLTAALAAVLTMEFVASLLHLRRSQRVVRLRFELLELVSGLTAAFVAIGALVALLGGYENMVSRNLSFLLQWFLAATALCTAFRLLLRLSTRLYRARGYDQRTVAFVGATETTSRLIATFRQNRWMGLNVAGVFDDRLSDGESRLHIPRSDIAGTIDHLVDLCRMGMIDVVYVTLSMAAESRIHEIIRRFADTTASVYYCPPLFHSQLLHSRWDDVFGQPVVSVVETPFTGTPRYLKKAEDLVLLALIAPVVIPVLLLAMIAVKLSSPGPIFYRQTRYGLDGRPFTIWKLRTMRVETGSAEFVQATHGDPRITRVGALLRKTSIDELPQLLNVLSGTMSVIGPRPHPVELNEQFRGRINGYMIRHKVKPGITGLAQVRGFRGETDTLDKMKRRVELDLQYLQDWSLSLDLKILLQTLRVPFYSRNAI